MLVVRCKLEKIVVLVDRLNQWSYSNIALIAMPIGHTNPISQDELKSKIVEGYLTLNDLKFPSKFRLHHITDSVNENEEYDFGIIQQLDTSMTLENFSKSYPELVNFFNDSEIVIRTIEGVKDEQSELLRPDSIESNSVEGIESTDQSNNQGEEGEGTGSQNSGNLDEGPF